MPHSESDVARLVKAAEVLLQHLCDCGDFGPDNPDPVFDYPQDEDGDLWYPDVWELSEALKPWSST